MNTWLMAFFSIPQSLGFNAIPKITWGSFRRQRGKRGIILGSGSFRELYSTYMRCSITLQKFFMKHRTNMVWRRNAPPPRLWPSKSNPMAHSQAHNGQTYHEPVLNSSRNLTKKNTDKCVKWHVNRKRNAVSGVKVFTLSMCSKWSNCGIRVLSARNSICPDILSIPLGSKFRRVNIWTDLNFKSPKNRKFLRLTAGNSTSVGHSVSFCRFRAVNIRDDVHSGLLIADVLIHSRNFYWNVFDKCTDSLTDKS